MNSNPNSSQQTSFLDIGDLLIKEKSPILTHSLIHDQVRINSHLVHNKYHYLSLQLTQIPNKNELIADSPIQEDNFYFAMTPVFQIQQQPKIDIFSCTLDKFQLQVEEDTEKQEIHQGKLQHQYQQQLNLERISQKSQRSSQSKQFTINHKQNDILFVKQSHQDSEQLVKEQSEIMIEKWSKKYPRRQLMKSLKLIAEDQQAQSSQKVVKMFEILKQYLFESEKYYLDYLLNSTSFSPQTFLQGVQKNFKRKIGGLCFQNRRKKLIKYAQKKKNRDWQKKINYACRKKVAQTRLRIKGKFVTQEEICKQLKISPLEGNTSDELKLLLLEKGKFQC